MPRVEIERERCKGCGLCVDVCPEKILAIGGELNLSGYYFAVVTNEDDCLGCVMCAEMCPDVAISVWR
ncbi:MAG: 4Fe-4S dicluster domain-containing protein [Deltaproteobacteria bacterium]|nr:4Fe-4S dicluster domain-containing protein [Deltaproteobacteria bacterium]